MVECSHCGKSFTMSDFSMKFPLNGVVQYLCSTCSDQYIKISMNFCNQKMGKGGSLDG